MVKEYLHSDMFSVTIASCYAFVTVIIGIQSTTSLSWYFSPVIQERYLCLLFLAHQKQGQYCLLSCFNLRGCMEIITAFHGISSACLYNHYINKHFNGHLYSLAKKRHLCTRISSFRISKYVILILVLDLKYICPSLYGVQWIILVFVFHTSITFLFKLNVDSRGGSRVVQVIYRNHSNFFPNLISQLFVAVHEINYPSCFIVYYEIKQRRN